LLLRVTVKPGSTQPGLTRVGDDITLRVRERAVEGAANEACVHALSEALAIPKSRITLVRGHRGRAKTFSIEGLDEAAVRERLSLDA
jgi:uncharacterized protein YggU (UPF0235/DUF167 family)